MYSKKYFDSLLNQTDFKIRILKDPVSSIYNYKKPEDREIVGLLASMFAYGRVEKILKNVDLILKNISNSKKSPYEIITKSTVKYEVLFKNFKHRFNSGSDLAVVLYSLKSLLKKYGSLENLFKTGIINDNIDIKKIIINFAGLIRKEFESISEKYNIPLGKTLYLLPTPERGSSCKRLNLFLRWMIRKDNIDPGVWNKSLGFLIPYLIIPLDVHIAKCGRNTGMTLRKTNDWQTASEITEYLKKIEPEDPLKYDFAICHLGMSEIRKAGKH
ncbi:TIGR02757 family protein [Candidatus Dependentiae bacterium]|nr:TIGR02757 family protein [Candidatus Dependentiae bacterium]